MIRQVRSWLWLGAIVCVSGCGDTISAVMRDYYNVEHEILDNMVKIVDDDSAKRYNDLVNDRLKKKEEEVNERREKLERGQFTEKDKKALELEIVHQETVVLKVQLSSLDTRLRQLQNRTRRLIVKLAEDKAAEEMKRQDKTFTVEAATIWPNLSSLAIPEKFGKADKSGGGMGGMMAPPMMGGMPGAGGGPAGAPPMPGGGAAGPGGAGAAEKKTAPAGPPLDPNANKNLQFVMTCERRGNEWNVSRFWKAGGVVLTKPLEVNGINITPVSSSQ